MNTPSTMPPPGWTPTRRAVVSLIFAGVLAGGVAGLTRWPELPSPQLPGHARLHLDMGRGGSMGASFPLDADPTQFALSDPHGFSGAAERALPRGDYELAEFTEPPTWLVVDAVARRAGQVPPLPAPQAPSRSDAPLALEGEPPAPPLLPETSQAVVRGGLADRPLAAALDVPSWASAEPLSATVVEIGVTPEGDVLLARAVVPCGMKAADDAAVALARTARFAPKGKTPRTGSLATAELAWGELVFQWRARAAE